MKRRKVNAIRVWAYFPIDKRSALCVHPNGRYMKGLFGDKAIQGEYNCEAHSSFTQGCEVLGNIYEKPELLKP